MHFPLKKKSLHLCPGIVEATVEIKVAFKVVLKVVLKLR